MSRRPPASSRIDRLGGAAVRTNLGWLPAPRSPYAPGTLLERCTDTRRLGVDW